MLPLRVVRLLHAAELSTLKRSIDVLVKPLASTVRPMSSHIRSGLMICGRLFLTLLCELVHEYLILLNYRALAREMREVRVVKLLILKAAMKAVLPGAQRGPYPHASPLMLTA